MYALAHLATCLGHMQPVPISDALDGTSVASLLSTPSNYGALSNDKVVFTLPTETSGCLWLRVRTGEVGNSGSNSFFVAIPGKQFVLNIDQGVASTYWLKADASRNKWASGDVIAVGLREHGAVIDAMAIHPGVPSDREAEAELGLGEISPPPPPPPVDYDRSWPYAKAGMGVPRDYTPAWKPHPTVALHFDHYHTWWPLDEGLRDRRFIPFVPKQDAIVPVLEKLNDGRPIGFCNEPELTGDGAASMTYVDAANLVHEIAPSWKGFRFGLNTVLDRTSPDGSKGFVDSFWGYYTRNFGEVPFEGLGLHFYTQVLYPYRSTDPWGFTTATAVEDTIALLLRLMERNRSLGRPSKYLITEGFGLAHPDHYARFDVMKIREKMAGLWFEAISALQRVPEVISIMPFSSSYWRHTACDHVYNDGEPTILGVVYNWLFTGTL